MHTSGHYKNRFQKNPNIQTALTLLYLQYEGNLIYSYITKKCFYTHTNIETSGIIHGSHLFLLG